MWEHFTKVSSEGSQVLRQVCIKVLVEEHQAHQTIVHQAGGPGSAPGTVSSLTASDSHHPRWKERGHQEG